MSRLCATLAVVVAAGLAAAGCGTPEVRRDSAGTPPPERADRRPPLPGGWHRTVNERAGFSLGLPPRWTARPTATGTLVRSADGGLVLAVTADRSATGQRSSALAYARRAARELRGVAGYRNLRVQRPAPVPGTRYPTASVTATGGLARTGVRQDVLLVVVHRPRRVTYALTFFRAAGVPASRYVAAIYAVLGTFTAQPPAV